MGLQYTRAYERRRPIDQIAYEAGTSSSCTRINLGLRCLTETAMFERRLHAEEMSDFSGFFMSILHDIIYGIEPRCGVNSHVSLATQDAHALICGIIMTASGPTAPARIGGGVGQGDPCGGPRSQLTTLGGQQGVRREPAHAHALW